MDTLKIEIPKGCTAEFDKNTGVVTFLPLPKPVTERIKSFDDVLSELGIKPKEWEKSISGLDPDEIAYRQAKLITKCLNEDWFPNWNDSNEYKYYPWFRRNDPSAVGGFSYFGYDYDFSDSFVGSRLCFKTSELAKYAGTQFVDIYKEFFN